eukprot:2756787-Amphidinium_carterae.1
MSAFQVEPQSPYAAQVRSQSECTQASSSRHVVETLRTKAKCTLFPVRTVQPSMPTPEKYRNENTRHHINLCTCAIRPVLSLLQVLLRKEM